MRLADIKPDNIMVSLAPTWTHDRVAEWIQQHPPRVYGGSIQSLHKQITTAFVTERFPLPELAELEQCDFKLADLSSGRLPPFGV